MPRWVRLRLGLGLGLDWAITLTLTLALAADCCGRGAARTDELGLREHEALVDVVREVVHGTLRRLLLRVRVRGRG